MTSRFTFRRRHRRFSSPKSVAPLAAATPFARGQELVRDSAETHRDVIACRLHPTHRD